jgi:hypothetical protein
MIKNTTVSIPDVLVGFLHEMLDNDPSVTMVTLIPSKLGWGLVQDILLQTPYGESFRRVYGFDLVDARLRVEHVGSRCDFVPAA